MKASCCRLVLESKSHFCKDSREDSKSTLIYLTTMSFLDLLSLSPNIHKIVKVWEYQYDKVWYFGLKNASGTLRFTNHHDHYGHVTIQITFQILRILIKHFL